MVRIQLERRRRLRSLLARRFQQPLQVPAHLVFVADDAGRGLGQPRGNAHVFDALAERTLDTLRQVFELLARLLLGRFFLFIGQGGKVQPAFCD
jgi:hypothetical protein